MTVITKDNLATLLAAAENSEGTKNVESITLGCSGSCNNAQNMFHIHFSSKESSKELEKETA